MLRLYCYAANKERNIGFRKNIWNLTEKKQEPAENGTKEIWMLLEDAGCNAVCASTQKDTVFFLMKNYSTSFAEKENWYIHFAIEGDRDSYDLWRNMCAAFLVNYEKEMNVFAENLSAVEEAAAAYEFNIPAYTEHINSLENAASYRLKFQQNVPGRTFDSWKKAESLLKQLESSQMKWCSSLYLLVPEVTRKYFYDHCEVKLPRKPDLLIEKGDWQALLRQKEPAKATVSQEQNAYKAEKIVCGIAGAAVVGAGIYLMKKKTDSDRQ